MSDADLKKIYSGNAAGVTVGGLVLLNSQYYDDIDIEGERFLKCGLIETDEAQFNTALFKARTPKYNAYVNKNFSLASKMLGGGTKTVVPVEVGGSLYTIHENKIVRITNIFNFTFVVLAEIPSTITFATKLFAANGDLILAAQALTAASQVNIFKVDTVTGSINVIGATAQPNSSLFSVHIGDLDGGHLLVVVAAASNNAVFYRSTKTAGVYGAFDNIGTISDATTGGAVNGVERGRLSTKTNCYFTTAGVAKLYNVTSSGVTTDTTTRVLVDPVYSQFAGRWLTYSATVGKCFYSADTSILGVFTATATDMFNLASIGADAIGFSYSNSTVDVRRLAVDGSVPSLQTLSLTCQVDASTGSGSREGNLEAIHDATGNNIYLLVGAGNNFSSILHSSTGLAGFSCKSVINNTSDLIITKSGADYFITPIGGASYFIVTTDFVNFEFKYQLFAGESQSVSLFNVSSADDGVSIVSMRATSALSATLKMSVINKTTKVVAADVDSGIPSFDMKKLDFICGKYVMFNSSGIPVKTATALNSWATFSGYNMLVKIGANAYAVNGAQLYSTSNLTAFTLVHTFASPVAVFEIRNSRGFVRLVNGQVLTSADFTAWSDVELSTSGALSSVNYLNGMYVAKVGIEYEYSTDGFSFDSGLNPFVYNDGLLPYDSTLMAGVFGKFAGGTVAYSQGSGDQYMRIS